MEDEFRVTAQELPGAIESLLFVSGDPISSDKLAELLNVKRSAVEEALLRALCPDIRTIRGAVLRSGRSRSPTR